jgi:cytochrome P450
MLTSRIGPPTQPLLGNLAQLPTSNAHFLLTEWAKQYGGIYSLKMAHATAIVLTDRRLIRELVDKKGAIYNSRPSNFLVERYVARDPANIPLVICSPSGPKLRLCRKILMQHFNEARVEEHQVPIIEAEASQMLCDISKEPEALRKHTMRLTNSLTKIVVYGTRTTHAHELQAYIEKIEPWTKILETGAIPPVDLLPWLQYVPQWLWRGAWKSWKSKGHESGKAVDAAFTELARTVLERRNRGVSKETLYDYLLDQWETEKGIDLTRRDLDIFAGSLIDAGTDTTASTIATAIQAMVKYPHVQKKAQNIIDGVVGDARSPRWEDVAGLSYVVQIVKETLRWRPMAPIMPHATTAGVFSLQGRGYDWFTDGAQMILLTATSSLRTP